MGGTISEKARRVEAKLPKNTRFGYQLKYSPDCNRYTFYKGHTIFMLRQPGLWVPVRLDGEDNNRATIMRVRGGITEATYEWSFIPELNTARLRNIDNGEVYDRGPLDIAKDKVYFYGDLRILHNDRATFTC